MNEKLNVVSVLSGHVSPETAYLVSDYPYGFRLRCQIRYWLEHHKTRGTRFVSQTTNPKKPGTVWNKPKASTYSDIAGAMYLDDAGHVKWSGLGYYPEAAEIAQWLATFESALPADVRAKAVTILAQKHDYERAKATGMDYRAAGMVATLATKIGYDEALARVNAGIQKAAAAAATPVFPGTSSSEIPTSAAA